jgi:hypothetical protein
MIRCIFFGVVLTICLSSYAQDPPFKFAGCYEVASIVWSPPDADIPFIPKRVELQNTPFAPGDPYSHMRSMGKPTSSIERMWSWRPKSRNRIEISWSAGLGGTRGTLKRSKNGDLAGTIKEWCDGRCGWKTASADILLRPIACVPN